MQLIDDIEIRIRNLDSRRRCQQTGEEPMSIHFRSIRGYCTEQLDDMQEMLET